MTKNHLKLVYSSNGSQAAREGFASWKLENSCNLDLFDHLDSRIFVIATKTANFHQFVDLLNVSKPSLIIETCKYPSYYRIFKSLTKSLEDFKRRGIVYQHIPLNFKDEEDNEKKYKSLVDFKDAIQNHAFFKNSEKKSPIFVFTSTEYHCDMILKKIQNFCAINLPGVKFEVLKF